MLYLRVCRGFYMVSRKALFFMSTSLTVAEPTRWVNYNYHGLNGREKERDMKEDTNHMTRKITKIKTGYQQSN